MSTQKINSQYFHIFEFLNSYFIYSGAKAEVLTIDKPTYDFICLLKSNNDFHKAVELFTDNFDYNNDIIHEIISEVTAIVELGFLGVPDINSSNSKFETLLAQRYNSNWTKLELALAESCNFNCSYCYCKSCRDLPNQGMMTQQIAHQAITWLFAVSGKSEQVSITFFGGEPLLNKPVFRYVMEYSQKLARLHEKKVYYSMTTNGSLLDDEIISYIKKFNFGLMISLDGPKEIHDKQCIDHQGNGTFNSATAGIKRLMKRRKMVTVRATMVHPIPNVMSLVKYFEDFGFSRIVIGSTVNPVNPSCVDFQESDFIEFERQQMNEILPWVLGEIGAGKKPKYYPYIKELNSNPNVTPFKCGACRGTTTVGADGNLYPCHRFVGMKNWIVGNISTGPNIDQCKEFWRKYRNATHSKCNVCWAWAQCKGPCPWEIANSDGTFRNYENCTKVKRGLERSIYVKHREKMLSLQQEL